MTGVQTCALPIWVQPQRSSARLAGPGTVNPGIEWCDAVEQALFGGLALEQDGPVLGAAGTLIGRSTNLAVLAVEKETPLEQAEIEDLAEWIQLTSKPVDIALSYARWNPATHGQPLRLRDLPLEDLKRVPNIAEVERLLISVAMNKNQNNRGKAAAALGISREGLRRKLLRGYV